MRSIRLDTDEKEKKKRFSLYKNCVVLGFLFCFLFNQVTQNVQSSYSNQAEMRLQKNQTNEKYTRFLFFKFLTDREKQ